MYGIDLDEPGLLRRRSWRWLRTRIVGLLETGDSRIAQALAPKQQMPTMAPVRRR